MTDQTETPQDSSRRHFWLAGEDLGVFDEEKITTTDMIALEMNANMTVKELLEGVRDMRGRALVALVWFLRLKAGTPVHVNSIEFALGDLRVEIEPDPTPAPDGADAAPISGPSESSSDSAPTSSTP